MKEDPGSTVFLIAATAVALAAVAAGLFALGTPSAQRERALDRLRVQDLQRITVAMERHFDRYGALPPDLDTLGRQPGARLNLRDPETGEPYVYRPLDDTRYEVCAHFSAAHDDGTGAWAHGAGLQCFRRQPGPRVSATMGR